MAFLYLKGVHRRDGEGLVSEIYYFIIYFLILYLLFIFLYLNILGKIILTRGLEQNMKTLQNDFIRNSYLSFDFRKRTCINTDVPGMIE